MGETPMPLLDHPGVVPYDSRSMKTRAFKLSCMDFDDFTLAGYSVAGEESVIVAGELDVVFDIGRCPREAMRVNHVLLSHGHMDHAAGIAYYFSQRDFQGTLDF